mmetsp:Transcript_31055/g.81324  ORF Transcript_31055/g.81324 Transcript_31055/m.81324 type:complete len:943 (+) Transcript_31055:114-2942(+)
MAFARDIDKFDVRRFSLLLLETREIYYEDYSVHYFPPGCSEQKLVQRPIKGRLLVCSNSILFDPSDPLEPILKFPYQKTKKLGRWDAPLMSPINGDTLSIVCTEYVRMKEGNMVKPYVFMKLPKQEEFRFCPQYNTIAAVLAKAAPLWKAHQGHRADRFKMIDEITREHCASIQFNNSWLEDLSEKIILKLAADRVTPMVANPGRIMLTDSMLYFQPFNNIDPEPVQKFRLASVERVVRRRYLLRQVGLELFLRDGPVIFLAVDSEAERDSLCEAVRKYTEAEGEGENQGNMMLMWQNGELSNFDYLMYLNRMADRSFNDLTQYPVFPWVISDYSSKTLDLEDPKTFRDLTKPIGALNPDRLRGWKSRYDDMPSEGGIPKFLYGTHYSSPGYVLYYTVRECPEYMLCLQNGKYDNADRMFRSIAETWDGVCNGIADVKELIPEFYMEDGNFLRNVQRLDLGTTQDTKKVGDVALPPWAKDANDFVAKCREALECDYVSNNIHNWIDLIFGYKQRGPEAVAADNVFYYITYEGAVDLDAVADPSERESLQAQIMEFGQTPKQLFTIPHPPRRSGMGGIAAGPVGADSAVADGGAAAASPAAGAGGECGDDLHGGAAAAAPAATIQQSVAGALWSEVHNMSVSSYHKLHRDAIQGASLSEDGKTLYTVSQDCNLKLFSLDDLQQTHAAPIGDMSLACCRPLDDGVTVMVGSWDNNVYWYNVEFGRVMATLNAHDDAVAHVALFGSRLATASWDSTVKIWDYAAASSELSSAVCKRRADECVLAELDGVDSEIKCMDIHLDRELLVAGGSHDGQVVIWSLKEGYDIIQTLIVHDESVNDVAFSPDGQRVVSCGNDSTLKVSSVDHGNEISTFEMDSELCSIETNGQLVLGGGVDGSLVVFDIVQGCVLARHQKHTDAIRTIILSHASKHIITAGDDNAVCIWSTS